MSGILGVWNLDGRPVERVLLQRLSGTLAHRGPDGESLWTSGSAGLACQLFRVTPESRDEVQPLLGPSGVAVVFDGRLDNREELLETLRDLPTGCPDLVLVAAAYRHWGEDFAARLNGDFALAVLDPHTRRLLLVRDAIGIRPLYYTRAGDTFLFASEIKALLAHPAVSSRPNDETLADWVLRFPGEDNRGATFFEGIYSLPPAHLAILTPDRFIVRRYWDFDTTPEVRLPSVPAYEEAFRHHFDRAVRRRLRSNGPVAISVSGGLDSSSIFCWAESLRRGSPQAIPPLLGFSHQFPSGTAADEESFLVEIERQYAVAIERIPVLQAGPQAGVTDEVWFGEAPILNLQWHSDSAYLGEVGRQARVVLTGHWGDQVLFNFSYWVDQLVRGQWKDLWAYARQKPRHFGKKFPRLLLQRFLPDSFLASVRLLRSGLVRPAWDTGWHSPSFRRRIQGQEIAWRPFQGPFATAYGRSLYLQVRARYSRSLLEWSNKVAARHRLEAAYPFLDRDFVGFLMRIPGEVASGEGVRKRLLRGALRGVLPEVIARRTGKARFNEVVNAGTRQDYHQLLQCLGSGGMMVDHGYTKGAALKRLLPRLGDGLHGHGVEASVILRDLLGLELWLKAFFPDLKGVN